MDLISTLTLSTLIKTKTGEHPKDTYKVVMLDGITGRAAVAPHGGGNIVYLWFDAIRTSFEVVPQDMAKPFRPGKFKLNGREEFVGYTNGDTYKKWARPWFDHSTAEKVLQASDLPGLDWNYNKSRSEFTYYSDDGQGSEDIVARGKVVPGVLPMIYPIGDGWDWVEIDAPGNLPADPKAVAATFIDLLAESITRPQLDLVVERNKGETDANVCHSHDFIDANMVMLAALVRHDLSGDHEDDGQRELFNTAWGLAKAAEFDKSRL